MSLLIVTQPASEPVTVAEARSFCGFGSNDTSRDSELERMIAACRRDVERFTRRALITQSWRLRLPKFPTGIIYLPRPPLRSVTSIVYADSDGDSVTLSSSLYQVDTDATPGTVEPEVNESWPSTEALNRTSVAITYEAGYGSSSSNVPAEFRQLILEMVNFRMWSKGDMQVGWPETIKWSLNALRAGTVMNFFDVKSSDV